MNTCDNGRDTTFWLIPFLDAGIKGQHTQLTDMEYADDVFSWPKSPSRLPSSLQALITALADCRQELYMQVSIAKTKVTMMGDDMQHTFTCTNQPVEQDGSLQYLGFALSSAWSHCSPHHLKS